MNLVLKKHNLPKADKYEIQDAIKEVITQKGDVAVEQLLKQHPDFDVIKEIILKEKNTLNTPNTPNTKETIIENRNAMLAERKVNSSSIKIDDSTKQIIAIAAIALIIYKIL